MAWYRSAAASLGCAARPSLAALGLGAAQLSYSSQVGRSGSCKSSSCEDAVNVDVVVVGGGIAGISTAWNLARRQRKVLLIEKEGVGSGATRMSAATIACTGGGNGTEFKTALSQVTAETLRELTKQCPDVGFVDCGSLELVTTESQLQWAKAQVERLQRSAYDVSLLSLAQVQRLEPALHNSPELLAAIHAPGHGYADPGATMDALELAASSAGAEIWDGHQVVGAEASRRKGQRWVIHVASNNASSQKLSVHCKDVVLAPGAQAAEVGRLFGVELPVVKVQAQMWTAAPCQVAHSVTPPLSHVIYSAESHFFWDSYQTQDWLHRVPNAVTHDAHGERYCYHLYGRPAKKGSPDVWFGGDRLPIVDESCSSAFEVNEKVSKQNFDKVVHTFPALNLEGQEFGAWCGVLGATMHGMPLIGELHFLPGLWLCTGFGGSGFMQGIGAGVAVADWITSSKSHSHFDIVKVKADPNPWVCPTTAGT